MKVLMINGSPRRDGNTSIALEEMRKIFEAEGVEVEIVRVGHKDVRGCIACGRCYELGKIASSQYWNSIHGREQGEAQMDEEGKQTMRVLTRNMVFLMKSIALGKEKFGLPEKEERVATHFIR